ncbi:MAG: haloacid dehalogenase-like hydrolase [Candidatus Methanomethylophilaceae archaeon]|nr:haloacid dehalogenase-like hydrolase [Candidatus Methanomethylophilaceae archaeon]
MPGSDIRWKAATAVAVCLLLIVSGLYISELSSKGGNSGYVETDMSYWVDGSDSKEEFVTYLKAITDEKNNDYIPPEDRIAVFDLDGTLFCERDPWYFDLCLFIYRVLEDPDYKDKASQFEIDEALIQKAAPSPGILDDNLEAARALAFAGMTIEEMNDYIQAFKKTSMPSYTGMLRGEGFYKPMLQMVDALEANGFTVYVISGTDRLTVRGLLQDSALDLPADRIIGSDKLLVSENQGNTDGSKYVYKDGEEIIYGGEHLVKDLNMNKVLSIINEIGKQPVLAFGNSSSDSSMATYTTYGNEHRSMAYFLCCDDLERENGNMEAAQKMYDLCDQNDWTPISMKNDWTTIYGDGVKKK